MAGVHVAPFPDPCHYGWPVEQATDFALRQLDYILQTLTAPADTAAFFVEPVLGEGGYVPANERFFAGLRERADKYGILLVVDEVQTGFGRTGKFWGGEHFDAQPGHPGHREGPGLRLPAVRHRRVVRADGEGVAGIAGRHLRRERGGLRGRGGDPRRDPRRGPGARTPRDARRATQGRRCSWSPTSTRRSPTCAGSG